jgi:hypothetical protein
MGRYESSFGGERRVCRRSIPLTPGEDALIRAAAETAGLKPTPYTRELLLRSAGVIQVEKPWVVEDRVLQLLEAASAQSRRIGNNLNQLTRMSNRMGELTQIPELRHAVVQSCEVTELCKKAIDQVLKAVQ